MKQFRKLVGPYCFWLFVLTVVPMLLIMIYAFVQKGNTITTFNFTLENFSKFFDPIFVSLFVKSFVLGAITTVLCLAIGYPVAYAISRCKEKDVYKRQKEAFTHPSYANENKMKNHDYERLEFLGDAVLQYHVSRHIFDLYPELPEGRLTKLRAKLVREESLARFARRCV